MHISTAFWTLLLTLMVKVKVAQLCPTLLTPWTIQSMEFSRPEYWSRYPFPSPGYLPTPGTEPRFPTMQTDSLPAESQGKPVDCEGYSIL